MDWLFSLALWSTINIGQLLIAYVLGPLVKFGLGYLSYILTGAFFTFLLKLRYEIYNEDLKLNRNEIKNRALLITGAGSGIGLALARHFFHQGFTIFACFWSQDEPGYEELTKLASSSEHQEQRMHLLQLDVRSQESISSCHSTVENILANHQNLKLHALLNVAGVGLFQKFQWTPKGQIRNLVETNLIGPMLMTREFLHLLIRTPNARVVNVASPLGIFPSPFGAVYGPTKAALAHFSSELESDTTRYKLSTVTIQPGNVMSYTSIISSSLAAKMAATMDELSEEERVLYKDEMVDHQKLLDLVAKAFQRRKPFEELRPMRKFAVLAEGGILEDRLDDSISFLKNFENSVCLRNPPREMFAGNMLFNLISGSLIQWMPRIFLRDAILNWNQSNLKQGCVL